MNQGLRTLTLGLTALAFIACGTAADPAGPIDASSAPDDAAGPLVDATADVAESDDTAAPRPDNGGDVASQEDGALTPDDAESVTAELEDDATVATDSAVEDTPVEDITSGDVPVADDGSGASDSATEDATIEGDSAVEEDAVEGDAAEDTESAPDVGVDTDAVEDTATPGDDIAGEDTIGSDTECAAEGTWTLETTTAAAPGEGCAPNGEPAQGANTKIFTVTQNPDGSLTGVLPEVTEPIPEITVTQSPEEACSFVFVVGVSVYFPPLGGEEPSTVYLTYTYTVSLADGGVHGSGTVYSATIFESGEVQQECTEAISVGGSFTPLGG